jgi:hypothetical protein
MCRRFGKQRGRETKDRNRYQKESPCPIASLSRRSSPKKGENPPFVETILLRGGFYVGRKFRAGGFQIVWWAEKNVAEVFDEDGQVMETIALEQKLGMAG